MYVTINMFYDCSRDFSFCIDVLFCIVIIIIIIEMSYILINKYKQSTYTSVLKTRLN